MINVQTVIDRMKSALDAEGSDRYLFTQDFKPAIDYSVEWIVSVFNAAFADKKLTEEELEELIYTRIWQANDFSRIHFNAVAVGDDRWSILRIAPEPEVFPATIPPVQTDPVISVYRPDLSFVRSKFSAKRLTQEKWDENSENIFEAGNTSVTNQLKSYAYLNSANYASDGYQSAGGEIEIRPSVAGQFVSITYIKYPNPITAPTDVISFPKTLTTLVVTKALNFISFKQGDQTNLYTVTAQDVATLAQLMT